MISKFQDIREEISEIEALPGKRWFRTLDAAVIEADRCIRCGTCVTACPSGSISIAEDDRPTLVRMCTGCSRCWDFCPRSGLRYESVWQLIGDRANAGGLGTVQTAYTARTKSERLRASAQDGGVITTILETLLTAEENGIDGALIAKQSRDRPWKGEAFLATTVEALHQGAGSFYNQTMALGYLNELNRADLPPDPRIAIVGTPCEIVGIKALQQHPWEGSAGWQKKIDAVVYTIALMCTRNFDYDRLAFKLKQRDIELEAVGKIDVIEGELHLYDKQGEVILQEDIRRFHDAALRGCDECGDFTGKAADITVGSIGSRTGYSSVLIRTSTGGVAWEIAKPLLDYGELDDLQAVDRIERRNERRAVRFLRRSFDPDASLDIGVEDHLKAYTDSDRGPQPLNPNRVYQYEEVC
ncbi:MAG: Coenzyme F420 hydrogenase/dehydrogenase, beta subunit C-terminal domain [Candidatus Bipolaricaulia bacterium]